MALAVSFALLAAFGFGSGTIFIRLATQRLSAPATTFFVVAVGAIIAVCLALAFNLSEMKSQPASAFAWFVLLGALGYPIARLLHYTAISLIGATSVAPIISIAPVFAVGLAIAVLGERPNLLVGLGTPVVVGGLVLVVLGARGPGANWNPMVTKNMGYLLAFAAALTFGGREVLGKHVVTDVAPPLVASALGFLIGACMLRVLSHRDVVLSFRQVPMRYFGICGLAGVCQGLAAIFVLQALSRAPVTVVSPIYFSFPLVVLVLSHLFLQRLEGITPILVVGTVLSLAGVVIIIVGAGL